MSTGSSMSSSALYDVCVQVRASRADIETAQHLIRRPADCSQGFDRRPRGPGDRLHGRGRGGRLLAVSLQARGIDLRVPRPGRRGSPCQAGGIATQAAVVASLSPPATESSAEARMLDPIGALALVIPESSDSPGHHGFHRREIRGVGVHQFCGGQDSQRRETPGLEAHTNCRCPGPGWRRSDRC